MMVLVNGDRSGKCIDLGDATLAQFIVGSNRCFTAHSQHFVSRLCRVCLHDAHHVCAQVGSNTVSQLGRTGERTVSNLG